MHAADIRHPLPTVRRDTPAVEAARVIAEHRFLGLVVVDDDGEPEALIAGVDVLRLLLPDYIRDDPSLARVWDEQGADEFWAETSRDRTVGELLDDEDATVRDILRIDGDATLIEVASELVQARSGVALVTGGQPDEPLFVTLPTVLEHILAASDRADDA